MDELTPNLQTAEVEEEELQVEEEVSTTSYDVDLEGLDEEEVNPYEVTLEFPNAQDVNRRMVDALNAASRASALGQDPLPSFEQVFSNPAYDADDISKRILDNVRGVVENGQQAAMEAYREGREPDLTKFQSAVTAITNSPVAMQESRAYVESMPGAEILSETEKEDLAFLKYVERLTATVADEVGWNWSTVGDMAGFLVPQENLRYSDVAAVLNMEYDAGDYIDYRDFLARMSAHIRSEAPSKRKELVDTLVNSWPEIKGNNRIALLDILGQVMGDDPYGDMKTFENYMERFDQATLGLGLGKFVAGVAKGVNALRVASRMGNVEAVADMVEAGARGQLAGANISPLDAAASLDPSDDITIIARGADNTHASAVGRIQREVDIILSQADDVDNFGLGLSPEARMAARDRAVAALEAQEGVYRITAEEIDSKSFEISYRTRDDSSVRYETVPYTVDDMGATTIDGSYMEKFNSVDGKGFINIDGQATSPQFRHVADRDTLVAPFEQIMFQGSYIGGVYDAAVRAALSPQGKKLSRKEIREMNDLLIKGDEWVDELGFNSGRVFDRDGLVDGTELGYKVSPRVADAYVGMRRILDHLHTAKEKQLLEAYEAKGVKIIDWGETQTPVKPYDTVESAMAAFRSTPSRTYWTAIDHGGKVKPFSHPGAMDSAFVTKMYDQGYRLVRAVENRFLSATSRAGDVTNVEWAFVKAESIIPPRGRRLLNKKEGYVPRIMENSTFFVKVAEDINIGGSLVKGGMLKTIRYFDNLKDADTFANAQRAANPGKDYRVLADRELSATDREAELINVTGGLFTGKRGEGIPFGLDGSKGKRLNPLESLQRYIQNISRNVPLHLYRIGIQERWLNHAKDVGALPRSYQGSFADALGRSEFVRTNPTAPFLESAHKQISAMTGVRTVEEQKVMARNKRIARWIGRNITAPIGNPLARKLVSEGTEGFISMMRSLNFHLMLGIFNVAQFPIQASGALAAISISPKHGLKAVTQLYTYGALDNLVAKPAEKAAMIAYLRRKGFDVDGYELWDKSGVRESIMKSNSDYGSLMSDLPYDAGMLQRLLAKNTMFHKAGEMVSARVAFATAYNEMKAARRGGELGEYAIRDILKRSEVLRLNMTKANSAGFQEGVLSIPFQFQQVNTKFFEKLLGRGELTKREKLQLLVAQGAMFGSIGVPLFSTLVPIALDTLNKALPEESRIDAMNASPETLTAIRYGAIGWLLTDYMDINNVVTGRMALGQDFLEGIFGFITGSTEISDVVLGPSSTVISTGTTGLEKTLEAFMMLWDSEDATVEDYVGVAKILAKSVAELPSSTRNLIKAHDMANSQYFKNKKGRHVAEWTEVNTQTLIVQALGFAPQEVEDYYDLMYRGSGSAPPAAALTDADRIIRIMADLNSVTDGNEQRYNQIAINAIMSKYSNPQARIEVINEVHRKLKEPSDAWSNLMAGIIKEWELDIDKGFAAYRARASMKTHPLVARKLAEAGMNTAVKNEGE